MKNQLLTIEQLKKAQEEELLRLDIKSFKKTETIKMCSVFFLASITEDFLWPAAKELLTFTDADSNINLPGAALKGSLAIGAGIGLSHLSGKIKWNKKREKLQLSLLKEEIEVREIIKNLNISYHNMFKSYVDNFEIERELYSTWIQYLQQVEVLMELEDEFFKIDTVVKDLDKQEKSLSEEILELNKAKKEASKEKSGEDIPEYANPKESKLKENLKSVTAALKTESANLKEARKALNDLEKKVEKSKARALEIQEKDLPCVWANREARKKFEEFFIDGSKKSLNEIKELQSIGQSYEEVAFAKIKLKKIKSYFAFITKHYNEFTREYDLHIKFTTSTLGRIKNKKQDRTYASAPFWQSFQVFSSPEKHANSKAFKDEVEAIIAGAKEDYELKNPEFTWYYKRNYQEDWLIEIGDFSKEEAERLTEILKDYIDKPITVDCDFSEVKASYREFLRNNHPDINAEIEDNHLYAEASRLIDKLHNYIRNKKKLFNQEDNQ